MKMSTPANCSFAALFLLCGCAADDTEAMITASASASVADDDEGIDPGDESGPCEPGSPGCECADDMCLDPLICLGGSCVWPPPDDDGGAETSDDGGSEDGSDDGTDGGADDGPTACSVDGECDSSAVCFEGECMDARNGAYQVRVSSWSPVSCGDGGLGGAADLWWQLQLDGTDAGHSGWTQGGCPGSWPTTTICVPQGGFYSTYFLALWDEDGSSDDLIDAMWWDFDDDSLADPLDPFWLHMGGFEGETGSGGSLSVEFTLVDGCD